MIQRADELLICEQNYAEAKKLYLNVLDIDPENIDCLNSVATCIQAITPSELSPVEECLGFYQRALAIDSEDYETNFNIGNLFY